MTITVTPLIAWLGSKLTYRIVFNKYLTHKLKNEESFLFSVDEGHEKGYEHCFPIDKLRTVDVESTTVYEHILENWNYSCFV